MINIPISRSLGTLCSVLLVSASPALGGVVGTVVDAEKEDQLTDTNTDTRANPGETVKYTVRVNSTGGDASNLSLDDVLDGRTALSGIVKSLPLALPDSFITLGNLRIEVPEATGLLANDVDAENIIKVDGAFQHPPTGLAANFGLTATAEGPKVTANGGSVTIVADGSFTYDPPPGFTGPDTFSYTLKDGDMNADSGTATVSVSGPVTWFVDAAAAPAGDGTQGTPYQSLAEYNAGDTGGPLAPGDGDLIHIASSGTPYDGGIRLRANQQLIGGGASLASILTTAPAEATLPVAGAPPTITNTIGALGGHGVELAMGNTITGLGIGNTPSGYGISGNNFGTLSVDNSVSISGAGGGLDLNNGVSAATFASITAASAGAFNGVRATGVTGTLNLGVCNLTTTSGKGFDLSGGATFNSTSGSISTGTGVAVDAEASVLGLTLTSVSCNGAVTGIDLLNTTGTFTVTGDGASAMQGGNDSGGILQNTSNDAIKLNNVTSVSLKHMTIGDPSASASDSPDGTNNINGDGIDVANSTGLTLDQCTIARTADHGINAGNLSDLSATHCLILNAGDGQEEHGFKLANLSGDNFVSDSLFDAFNETGIEVINTSANADLTIDNTTFQDNQMTVGNAGEEAILLIAQGTAQIVALVTGDSDTNTTQSIFDALDREAIQAISEGTSSDIQLTVENSRFLEHGAGDGIIIFNPDGAGSGNITVKDNFFTDTTFGPFAVLLKNDSSGMLDATIDNNIVNKMQLCTLNHDNIGGGGSANGTSRALIEDNVVDVQSSNFGIDIIATDDGSSADDPDCSLAILNNTITIVDGNFSFTGGMRIQAENTTRMNTEIRLNTANSDPSAAGGSAIELKTLDTAVIGIKNLVGSADTFLDGLNTLTGPTFIGSPPGTFVAAAPVLPLITTLPSP